jgi:hypothetical protein
MIHQMEDLLVQDSTGNDTVVLKCGLAVCTQYRIPPQ